MATSPHTLAKGALRVTVNCNGDDQRDLPLVSATVRHALDSVPFAQLVVADGDADGNWTVSDSDLFAPGAAVAIKAGYGEREEQLLFSGKVVRHALLAGGAGAPRLIVECHDPSGPLAATPPQASGPAVLVVTYGLDLHAFEAHVDAFTPWNDPHAGLARVRGRIHFQGSALAKPGTRITLAGVGARFNGDVFVAAAEHQISDGGWATMAEFGLDPASR